MNEIISYNPATLEDIGRVRATLPDEVSHHVEKAKIAAVEWQRIGCKQRSKYLLEARKYLLKNIREFARAITIDNGKPLVESVTAEIYPVADLIFYYAHHTEKILKPFKQPIGIMGSLRRSSYIHYLPYGTVGIISPWNYPFSIPAGAAVMALMAGNTVLLKPSSVTPIVGQKIAEMFAAANLPEGVFTHLPGDSKTGEALIDSGIDKMIFTGSVGVGKRIMEKCSKNLTAVVLELGGKDPMIVLEDADLDHASSGAVWGAFTNCGQTCAAVERVYVHKKVFELFLEKVIQKTRALKVGNGIDPDMDIGPLTTREQFETVEEQVKDAVSRGGKIEYGGNRIEGLNGYFFQPTVITGVDHSSRCMQEETFGPLLPIMTFTNVEDAVKLANDSQFGLTASIWTKDIKLSKQLASQINAGTVTINEAVYTHALSQTPWGGVKKSGIGRTHSRFGLMELVRTHHIHINRFQRKSMWWYGYNKNLYYGFMSLAKNLTGGILSKIPALPTFIKILFMKKR